MILWRPSEHFKRYAYYIQPTGGDDDNDDDEEARELTAPDNFADHVTKRTTATGDSDDYETPDDDGNTGGKEPTFAIGDDGKDNKKYQEDKPKTTLAQTIEITEDQSAKID